MLEHHDDEGKPEYMLEKRSKKEQDVKDELQ